MAYGEKEDKPWYEDLWEGAKEVGSFLTGGGRDRPPSPGAMGYQSGPDPTMGVTQPGQPMGSMPGRQPDIYPTSGAPIEAPDVSPESGVGSKLWNWAKENPELIAGAAGTGYGMYQQEAQDRTHGLQEGRVDLEETEADRRQRERDRERERRRRLLELP